MAQPINEQAGEEKPKKQKKKTLSQTLDQALLECTKYAEGVDIARKEIVILNEKDEEMRKQLSKALGAPSVKKERYGDEYETLTWSWYEIFQAIGRMNSKEDYANFVKDIQEAHKRIDDVSNSLHNYQEEQRWREEQRLRREEDRWRILNDKPNH